MTTTNVDLEAFRSNGRISDRYALQAELGEGASSKVFRCRDTATDALFAVKIVPVRNDDDGPVSSNKTSSSSSGPSTTAANVERELAAMIQLNDVPGAIKLRHFYEETGQAAGGHTFYIVMDLLRGSDVATVLADRGTFCEDDAQEIMRQVFRCCAEMHARNIIHRDIKLENIMLAAPSVFHKGVTVADFGLAICLDPGSESPEPCGTPLYIAPEQLTLDKRYGHQVDVWSCGVVLFHLLGGYPPFYSSRILKLFRAIQAGQADFSDPVWALVSEEAQDLIQRCLTVDPDVRITAEQALRHPWLAGGKLATPKLYKKERNFTW